MTGWATLSRGSADLDGSGMGYFTTTDGSHLVRQQGDNSDGFSRKCDEFDLVALAVSMLHDDRAEITGLQALIRKILAQDDRVELANHGLSLYTLNDTLGGLRAPPTRVRLVQLSEIGSNET